MKAFLLLFVAISYCSVQASPVNDRDEGSAASEPKADPAKDIDLGDFLDIKEMSVEAFPNGTVKYETLDELIEIYRNGKNITKTRVPSHFEPEDENDREKRLVFYVDERLPVPDSYTSSFPYCAIGVLDNGCTAVFIGPYHALTSASCVYSTATNSWRGNYNIRRRRNCKTYGTRMYASYVRAVVGFTRQHNSNYNYALIVTTSRTSCYAGFGYIRNWPNQGFDLIGYPSDKTSVSGCYYESMYSTSCHVSALNSAGFQYRYRCDNTGAYGAPLFSEVPDQYNTVSNRGRRVVYGINSNFDSTGQYNYGTRITSDRFNQIVGWMRESGYDPLA